MEQFMRVRPLLFAVAFTLGIVHAAQAEPIRLRFDFSISDYGNDDAAFRALFPLGNRGSIDFVYASLTQDMRYLDVYEGAIASATLNSTHFARALNLGVRNWIGATGETLFFESELGGRGVPSGSEMLRPVHFRLQAQYSSIFGGPPAFPLPFEDDAFLGGTLEFFMAPGSGSSRVMKATVTNVESVPEPSTLLLLGMGALVPLAAMRRRTRNAVRA